ncbi:TRAP transporter substrate-binding protein, partial [Yoonia sp.]|uniref:TRAP transporter substrate-binding protein n=1 Tax=Yoonia sp. TaxID=2212373 RepID=UPI0039189B40
MTMTHRILAAVLAASLGSAASAQDVTLRLHQFLPAQANVPAHILDVWADKVEADSDGRIRIERYPSMQLGGSPPQLIDQVIDGVADIIWTLPGYTPGRFPQLEVFELPFISPDAEATSRAFWELAEERMMDSDFAAFKPLGLWVHGPGVIHANRPVTDIADLDGLKLRGPTRVITNLLTDLGATAIGMPVPAVPEALSRGVIDGAVIPWEVVPSLK